MFNHLPGVEHRNLIRDPSDHTEIVADEEHREATLLAYRLKQVEDLSLDRYIESSRRLVEN